VPVHGGPRVEEHLDRSRTEVAPQTVRRLPFRGDARSRYIDLEEQCADVVARVHWSKRSRKVV
jgi:hypothetical protein